MTQAAKVRAILRGVLLGVLVVWVLPILLYFVLVPMLVGAK